MAWDIFLERRFSRTSTGAPPYNRKGRMKGGRTHHMLSRVSGSCPHAQEKAGVRNLITTVANGAFKVGQRRGRRTRWAARRIGFRRSAIRDPSADKCRIGAAAHSRDSAGEFGDRVARGGIRTAARSCSRNGSLHLAKAGLHPSPSDDSCRRPDDRSCRKSRSFPKRDAFMTVFELNVLWRASW